MGPVGSRFEKQDEAWSTVKRRFARPDEARTTVKQLPATGEVVTVEVEVKITKWPRAAIKAYILKPSVLLLQ